jgi:hypothetical protein
MKKLLLVAAFAVFGFSNINVQYIQFGAKIGANFSKYMETPLNEKLSFQPEVRYSVHGFSIADDILALNYLNVPLMGKY